MDGQATVALARISDEDLDLNRHLEAVSAPGHGAVVTFVGQIRDHDPEAAGSVELVEYSAHPDAQAIGDAINADPELSQLMSYVFGLAGQGTAA